MGLFDKLFKIFSPTKKPQPDFTNIIAAKVVGIQKHPNADRLRLAKVDVGEKIIKPIVCGAFNFDVGAMVALALPGAKIAQNIHSETHEPFVLEKAKIRGIESQGMICAAFELGLSNTPGQGIVILKSDVPRGSQFKPEMIK
jgi:phenylalanyl-tRNA synthetase beta chain